MAIAVVMQADFHGGTTARAPGAAGSAQEWTGGDRSAPSGCRAFVVWW